MTSLRTRAQALHARAALSLESRLARISGRQARRLAADREVAASVDWPRMLLVIALPKSGSTWLASLLEEIPGYGDRGFEDPDGCTLDHDVCDAIFRTQPSDLLSVVKLHTRPTAENVAVVERYAPRVVVMLRDPRDACVSRYFHVLSDPTHRHHELYRRLDKERGLLHNGEVWLDAYVPWMAGWAAILERDRQRFHELRYESLRADPHRALAAVLAHYQIPLPASEVQAIVERVRGRTTFGLSTRSLLGGSTARRGVVGDWRNHLSAEHVAQFAAGGGDLLVALGYERDDSWTREAGGRP